MELEPASQPHENRRLHSVNDVLGEHNISLMALFENSEFNLVLSN